MRKATENQLRHLHIEGRLGKFLINVLKQDMADDNSKDVFALFVFPEFSDGEMYQVCDTRYFEPKIFKTLEAALLTCKRIGFYVCQLEGS